MITQRNLLCRCLRPRPVSWLARPATLALSILVWFVMLTGAAEASAATLTVNTLADSSDGSNSCSNGGTCSLRDAITQAATGSTIDFQASGQAPLAGIITLGSQLSWYTNLTIQGPGAALLTITGGSGGNTPIYLTGGTSTISGLTLSGGSGSTFGGAILVGTSSTNLTVNNCMFIKNIAAEYGGAILNNGTLTVNASTFYDNTASASGGAIANWSGGTLKVTNSTFTGNTATGDGGAILNSSGAGVVTLTNVTISENTAGSTGSGIFNVGGTVVLYNSILAPDICTGCTLNGNNLSSTTPPALGALAWNGGAVPSGAQTATMTMLPIAGGSGIIGQGTVNSNTPSKDQRGFTRAASGAIDLGAVQTNYLTVTTTNDSQDSGGCTASLCSLRDAINTANGEYAATGADITFGTLTGTITLNGSLGTLAVYGLLNINGGQATQPWLNTITISGGLYGFTIFTVGSTDYPSLSIVGLNLIQGGTYNNATLFGGALLNYADGSLYVSNVEFTLNNAWYGASILNNGQLVVNNSIFYGNNLTGGGTSNNENNDSAYGGGIANMTGTGTGVVPPVMAVSNSIFYLNYAVDGGAAVYNNGGTSVLTNDTITGNTQGSGNSIESTNANGVELYNTIVSPDGCTGCTGTLNGFISTPNYNALEPGAPSLGGADLAAPGAPTISPASIEETVGTSNPATFTAAETTGNPVPTYQWYTEGASQLFSVPSATSATYTPPVEAYMNQTMYSVIATNFLGSQTSFQNSQNPSTPWEGGTVLLTVDSAPVFYVEPAQNGFGGANGLQAPNNAMPTLFAVAEGFPTPAYTWSGPNGAITSCNTPYCTLPAGSTTGSYGVTATNAYGTASAAIAVTINSAGAPVIPYNPPTAGPGGVVSLSGSTANVTMEPLQATAPASGTMPNYSVAVVAGLTNSVTFTVSPAVSGSYWYVWYVNGSSVQAGGTNTYTLTPTSTPVALTPSISGQNVQVEISNSNGNGGYNIVWSAPVTLYVAGTAYYIDPNCQTDGSGGSNICGNGSTTSAPAQYWPGSSQGYITNAGKAYLQKAGTTYSGTGYDGTVQINLTSANGSPSAQNPTIIGSYGSASTAPTVGFVFGAGSPYLTVQNLNITQGLQLTGESNVAVMNNIITNPHSLVPGSNPPAYLNSGDGILLGDTGQDVVAYNSLSSVAVAGILIGGANNVVIGNQITTTGDHGIAIEATYSVFQHNIVYGAGGTNGSGIHTFANGFGAPFDNSCNGNVIEGNVTYGTVEPAANGDGNGIQIDQHTYGNLVAYNLSFANSGQGISLFDSWNSVVYGNTFFNNGLNTGYRPATYNPNGTVNTPVQPANSLFGDITIDGGYDWDYGNFVEGNTSIIANYDAEFGGTCQQPSYCLNNSGTPLAGWGGPFGYEITKNIGIAMTGTNTQNPTNVPNIVGGNNFFAACYTAWGNSTFTESCPDPYMFYYHVYPDLYQDPPEEGNAVAGSGGWDSLWTSTTHINRILVPAGLQDSFGTLLTSGPAPFNSYNGTVPTPPWDAFSITNANDTDPYPTNPIYPNNLVWALTFPYGGNTVTLVNWSPENGLVASH